MAVNGTADILAASGGCFATIDLEREGHCKTYKLLAKGNSSGTQEAFPLGSSRNTRVIANCSLPISSVSQLSEISPGTRIN